MANIKQEVEIHVNKIMIERIKQLEEAIKPIMLEYRGYLLARSLDDDFYDAAYVGVNVDFLKALDDALESGL